MQPKKVSVLGAQKALGAHKVLVLGAHRVLVIHKVLAIHKVLGAHKVRSEHKGSINLYSHRGYKRVGAGFLLAHTKTYPLML